MMPEQDSATLSNLFSDLKRFGNNEEFEKALKTANKSIYLVIYLVLNLILYFICINLFISCGIGW